MATLSKHGKEIGRLEYLTKTLAFMDDGTVLVNRSDGWKIHSKVKAGVTPRQAYQNRLNHYREHSEKYPVFAAYRRELIEVAGMKRARLHMTIELMPDDPDGVWSDCCDGYGDNFSATIDEIVELCRLYKAHVETRKEKETE